MNKYFPNPIDTTDINIDESLVDLLEKLAGNTHEVWSKGRIADGWVYGKKRDDTNKFHPCLVNYDDLPDTEKEYDRQTALETLKLILKLGYKILPPDSILLDEEDNSQIKNTLKSLTGKKLTLSELVKLWELRNSSLWRANPELYFQTGISFLKRGEALFAYDVFSEAINIYPDLRLVPDKYIDLFTRIRQQQALALAESGATKESALLLTKIIESGAEINYETYGLLGRTYKEMGLSEGVDVDEQQAYLKNSYKYYFAAYKEAVEKSKEDDSYYNGINAATVALFLGDILHSSKIATEVANICKKIITDSQNNSKPVMYWVFATLAESELLLGNIDNAKTHYLRAVENMENDMRGKISMHKQAIKILQYLNIIDDSFHQVFLPPTVLVFSGHMIDLPGAMVERFPNNCEQFVRQEIKNKLDDYNTCIVYSSAACGADIIFLEEVLNKGGEINIILPFDIGPFKKQSVDIIPDSNWSERFDALIEKSARVITLTQYNSEVEPSAYDFANRFIYGAALTHAKIISSNLEFLSVWDGIISYKAGGTSAAIQLWFSNIKKVNYIHPAEGLNTVSKTGNLARASLIVEEIVNNGSDVSYYNYLPLLFADVKGYSKLNEKQLVIFSTFFLTLVSRIFDKFDEGILSKRTQGDGLFVVFKTIHAAADFAYELNVVIASTKWQDHDLPKDLTIRISLDAGPCYSYIEPITKTLEFCGDYVNRAARMEPITPPGHIYASETFVALANVENITDYQFVYSGQVVLPKGHGIIPAYHMRKC